MDAQRLDVWLRSAGVGSRRTLQTMAAQGRIALNGQPVRDLSLRISQGSDVTVDGERVVPRQSLCIMLNKPAGVLCAVKDPAQTTVLDLLPDLGRTLFPVGRLDRDTTGLLLLTDDGALCRRLIRPENAVPKTYLFRTGRPLPEDAPARFAEGITLENGTVCQPALLTLDADRLGGQVTITQGMRHQIKRMTAACGVRVSSLHRLSIGSLRLDEDLAPGQWRALTEPELEGLQLLRQTPSFPTET